MCVCVCVHVFVCMYVTMHVCKNISIISISSSLQNEKMARVHMNVCVHVYVCVTAWQMVAIFFSTPSLNHASWNSRGNQANPNHRPKSNQYHFYRKGQQSAVSFVYNFTSNSIHMTKEDCSLLSLSV